MNICEFTVTESHHEVTCPGGSDGSIDLFVEGEGTFTFSWLDPFGSAIANLSGSISDLLAGNYRVTVSDSLGCEVILDIEIKDGEDLLPPVLTCPNNQMINLAPGACEAVASLQIVAFDDCVEPIIIQTDTSGLVSGDAFPIGTTTLSYDVKDSVHTVSCSFQITVVEYESPIGSVLSCAGPLNVSVDINCAGDFGANAFLSGNHYGCYDDFELEYTNHKGDVITQADFHEYIEKTIFVQVIDPESGNSCYTTLSLFDNLKPIITCSDTLLFSCATSINEVHPSIIGYPDVYENCGNYTLEYFDLITDLSCNSPIMGNQFSKVLHRTWTAVDEYENVATPCHQVFLFERQTITDVVFPLNLTDQPGALPSLECGNSDDSPLYTGTPMIDSLPIYPNPQACDFSIDYSDFVIDACGTGYNILRTWTVHDDCQDIIQSHIQIIRVKDKTPPEIDCPPQWSASTNVGDCTALLFIPQPLVTDNCSNFILQVQSSAGIVSGNLLYDAPLGNHILTYTAMDECGNSSTCKTSLVIHDGLSPTVLCKHSKAVSLTSDGKATVNAKTFDNGSYDDCIPSSALTFEIRRLEDACELDGTNWNSTVKFCCADAGTTVPVEIKVIDYFGNFNICGSIVHLSDPTSPSLTCPTDIEVACSFDYSDLSVFGTVVNDAVLQNSILINGDLAGIDGLAMDNCGVAIENIDNQFDINDCGIGTILRHFEATDPSGNAKSCTQEIQIVNNSPFFINTNNFNDPNDDAILPPHLSLSGCNVTTDPSATGEPILLGKGCDLATYTFQDEIINLPGNAWQIRRKWIIIDFCNYQNGQGSWNYFQYITVQNFDLLPPQIEGLTEIVKFCSTDPDCGPGPVSFSLDATDNCTNSDELNWEYNIDLFNDGTNDISGNSNTIFGELPVGIHRSFWKVIDEFGNESEAAQFLLVEDCLSPVLHCADTIQLSLNEDLFVSVFAEELDYGNIFDNCAAFEDLAFLLSPYNPDYALDYPPAGATDYLLFACPDAHYPITLWVKDENHNWGHCHFELHVFDNLNNCSGPSPSISIAGNIRTEDYQFIQNVEVNVNTVNPFTTTFDGNYAFYNLPFGGDYSVVPAKNTEPLNGVTTFDLVLIQKHILGTKLLESPYKMIAADINNSGSITTLDLLEMRKLILFLVPNFPNNSSWRFIDADFEFPNADNPFETAFPEYKSFNNLPNSEIVNFIGVKVGDVNGSANPNDLTQTDDRNLRQNIPFRIENQSFEKNELVVATIKKETFHPLEGFQFSLKFDADILEYQNTISKTLPGWSSSHINETIAENGYLHFSWNQNDATKAEDLLQIVFKAKANGTIVDVLEISNEFLQAEAYVENEINNVEIIFEEKVNRSSSIISLPNTPNPFYDKTVIQFFLSASGLVHFELFNAEGHLIKIKSREFSDGWQVIEIQSSDLPNEGIYFYTLKSQTGVTSGKIAFFQ